MASSKDDSIPPHRGTVPPNVLCLSPKLCHCKRPTIIQNSFRTHSKFVVFHSCRGYWKNNARNCNFFEWVVDEDVAIGVGNISMREAKESAIASEETEVYSASTCTIGPEIKEHIGKIMDGRDRALERKMLIMFVVFSFLCFVYLKS